MTPDPRRSRIVAPTLALATAAAALLRLPFLDTQSFWFDETYTVAVVDAGGPGELWDRLGASESTPPLFYVLSWGWSSLVGDTGEATVRIVAALALIAAVPATYAALHRLIGWSAALAASAIVAAAPVLVHYSLDARAYGLLVLTALLSVWAFSALLERSSSRRWALWAAACAAVIWTHWFGGFLVLAEAVTLLWLRPAVRRSTLLASAAVLATLIPLMPLLLEQTGDGRAAFITEIGLVERIEQLVRQFALGPNVPRAWLEGLGLAVALGGLALGALMVTRRALDSAVPSAEPDAPSPQDGARALLALALVALIVPLALAASGVYDRFNLRNVLFLMPLAAGIAAVGLVRLRYAGLAAYLALCVVTAVWIHSDWRYQNADWRGALREAAPADRMPVIAATRLGDPVAELYLERQRTEEPVTTRRALLVVESRRNPGQRALSTPAAPGPAVAALLTAFPQQRERHRHGFRLIELRAAAPVTLEPAQLPDTALLPAPAPRTALR